MKEKLLDYLYDFWKKNNDEKYNEILKKQLNDAIYKDGVKGADTLLDWCREDYEEYYKQNGITQEELEECFGDVNCGKLDDVWDICNYYLDYCNNDMTEEDILNWLNNMN